MSHSWELFMAPWMRRRVREAEGLRDLKWRIGVDIVNAVLVEQIGAGAFRTVDWPCQSPSAGWFSILSLSTFVAVPHWR